MRVRGQQRHFWPLTVNRMNRRTSAALPKPFCLAISEEKARALVIVAIWLVLDRFNYIINGAFDRVV